MMSNSTMKKPLAFIILIVVTVLGCKTHVSPDLHDEHFVASAVLAHMIEHADERQKTICFISATDLLPELQRRFEGKIKVMDASLAEVRSISFPEELRNYSDVFLKGTEEKGVMISVGKPEIKGDRAELDASYNHFSGWVEIHFKLERVNSGWKIISHEAVLAT